MSKCGKCDTDFISSDVIAKCVECKVSFHTSCTRLGSAQNFTKAKAKVWKCDLCRSESASVQSNEDALSEERKFLLDALNAMKNEIIGEVTSVRSALDQLTDELKSANVKIGVMEGKQIALEEKCSILEQENARLREEAHELNLRQHDLEQHSRAANIEIQGLPLTQREDMQDILVNIARALKVPFSKEDVSAAHRLRLFSKKHSHPPIIVQFVSRGVREAWLTAARAKKGLKSTEVSSSLQTSDVYVNEQLTANNKALLGRARRLVRERRLHFAGYVNGKVLVKQREGDTATRVLSIQDMDKYDK